METPRRKALRNYLLEVTRELVTRGALRMGKGQTLEAVLKHDLSAVLEEVTEDLKALGGEILVGLAQGAIGGALSNLFAPRR